MRYTIIICLMFLGMCAESNSNNITVVNIDPSKPNPALNRANFDNTVVVGTPEMSGNFLPAYYTTAYDAQVTSLVFESLYSGDTNGKIIPHLAESMPIISEDGLSYTVSIKKGVKFHNGDELTADDVVFTYKLLSDPSYDGRYASVVEDIVGYKEFNQKQTQELRGVQKIDDYTVRFVFKERLFSNIANLSFAIMNRRFYAYNYGDVTPVKDKMTQLVGTGAYILTQYQPRQFAQFIANTNYWGTQANIPSIIIKTVSPSTDVQELIRGDIDILPDILEPEKLIEANRTGFIQRNQYARHGYGYIMFNSSQAPTDDKRVRQALVYGLNRDAVNQIYFKGLAFTIDAPYSTLFWTYDEEFKNKLTPYPYNPQRAGELLDEAGWILDNGVRKKDGNPLVLDWVSIKDLPFVDVMSPVLIDNYQRLGITVRLSQIDFSSLIEKVYYERTNFNLFNMAVSESLIPSPYNVWHSRVNVRGGNNTGQYSNAELDNILDKMRRTLDEDEYKQLWQESILFLNEEMPIMPLYANIISDLYNRRVANFNTSSLNSWTSAILEAELIND